MTKTIIILAPSGKASASIVMALAKAELSRDLFQGDVVRVEDHRPGPPPQFDKISQIEPEEVSPMEYRPRKGSKRRRNRKQDWGW